MDLTRGDTATGHPVRVSCASTRLAPACMSGLRGYCADVRAVVITKPGDPDVLAVAGRARPRPGPARPARRGRSGRRQPGRPAPARGPLPAARRAHPRGRGSRSRARSSRAVGAARGRRPRRWATASRRCSPAAGTPSGSPCRPSSRCASPTACSTRRRRRSARGARDGVVEPAGRPAVSRRDRCWCAAAPAGSGRVAVQLARALGTRVLATAGGPQRTARVRGARCRRRRSTTASPDLVDRVLDATDGRGVDVVLDVLGARRPRGQPGDARRRRPPRRHRDAAGPARGARPVGAAGQAGQRSWARRCARARSSRRSRSWTASAGTCGRSSPTGRCGPSCTRACRFDQAADAHRLLESGEAFGKVLLIP